MKLRFRVFAILLVLAMMFAFVVGCTDTERLDELQSKIEALEGKNAELQAQLTALQNDLTAKQNAIVSLTADLLGLTGDLSDLADELLLANAKLLSTTNTLEDSKAATIAALTDIENSITNLTALSNEVTATYSSGNVVVLHTNDTHGRHTTTNSSFGMASLLALREIYENRGYTVILVDAGDAIQGTSLVNIDEGANAIDFMNKVGYDIAVPGNHELDWGFENLLDLTSAANFTYISANMIYSENNPHGKTAGTTVFDANKIVTVDGVKIGFFGLSTPETATKAHPAKVQGIEFLAEEEMAECAQEQVDYLRGQECDIVIALGHLGTSDESTGNRSIDVIADVDGIDVFIDGHSHSVYENHKVNNKVVAEDDLGETTILASTGEYFQNIGVLTFDNKNDATSYLLNNTVVGNGLKLLSSILYAELVKYIEEVNTSVNELLNVTFAVTEMDLVGERTNVRNHETNLGNFATDALLWQAREFLGDNQVDAALTNGGGIRATIKAGEITMNHMKTVFPYGNTVAVVTLTGEQLWEALEAATYTTNGTSTGEIGAFPQVSGIVFEIDTTKEWVQGTQYPSSTYFAPGYTNGIENENKRVTIISVGGVAFDKTATYRIATNDFTAAGGDTYSVFKLASVYDTGVAMEDALVNFVNSSGLFVKNSNGFPVITSALYGASTVGNRITIYTATNPRPQA